MKKPTITILKSINPWLFSALVAGVASCGPQPEVGSAPQPMTPGQFIFSTVWFVLVGVAVYVLLVVRPEAVKQEKHKEFVGNLNKNDEVVLSSGIFGKVVAVREDQITVEIAANVKVRVRSRDVHAVGKAEEKSKASPAAGDSDSTGNNRGKQKRESK